MQPARAGGGGTYDISAISVLIQTGDQQLDQAERYALSVLGYDFNGEVHLASPYYNSAWIRDSFAWGMIPSQRSPSVASYQSGELLYWLDRQRPFGGWITDPNSGYFDETPILISAVLDAYQVTGNYRLMRSALPRLERGWNWLAHSYVRRGRGSAVLLYTAGQHIAFDWADQVARRGYATQVEALWYRATRSLGIMEALADRQSRARFFMRYAEQIRQDINRLLWTSEAPYAFHAPSVPAFGHYRSWTGSRDYFELDSNFLCILYGLASTDQTKSIEDFVQAHQGYLLGLGDQAQGVPARVVYGDYRREDYAPKHNFLGYGRYQSAYWPSVGALISVSLASSGRLTLARAILSRLAAAFLGDGSGEIHEWYTASGTPGGAWAFQWAARMFLVGLYGSYLGLEPNDTLQGLTVPAGLRLRRPAGEGMTQITYQGRTVTVQVVGQGAHLRLSVGQRRIAGSLVPLDLLCHGCTISAVWGT